MKHIIDDDYMPMGPYTYQLPYVTQLNFVTTCDKGGVLRHTFRRLGPNIVFLFLKIQNYHTRHKTGLDNVRDANVAQKS